MLLRARARAGVHFPPQIAKSRHPTVELRALCAALRAPQTHTKIPKPNKKSCTCADGSVLTTRCDGFLPKGLGSQKGALDPTQKGALDPTQKGALDPTQKGALDPNQKGALGPTQKGALDPTQKGALGPTRKSALGPTQKGALDLKRVDARIGPICFIIPLICYWANVFYNTTNLLLGQYVL